MATAQPIPDELWARLARLDGRCNIFMSRTDTDQPTDRYVSKRGGRVWRVQIVPRVVVNAQAPVCESQTLAGAIEGAVRMAEQLGWDRPA